MAKQGIIVPLHFIIIATVFKVYQRDGEQRQTVCIACDVQCVMLCGEFVYSPFVKLFRKVLCKKKLFECYITIEKPHITYIGLLCSIFRMCVCEEEIDDGNALQMETENGCFSKYQYNVSLHCDI